MLQSEEVRAPLMVVTVQSKNILFGMLPSEVIIIIIIQ